MYDTIIINTTQFTQKLREKKQESWVSIASTNQFKESLFLVNDFPKIIYVDHH